MTRRLSALIAPVLLGCGGDGGSSESDVLVPAIAEEVEDVVAFAPARGTLDPTFGVQGIEITSLGSGTEYGLSAVLQPDGCILVAGQTSFGMGGVCVIRYLADGKRDVSFGNDGVVVTRFGSSSTWGRAVLVQPDRRIVVACDYYRPDIADFETALVRYTPDGSLDPSFGEDGIVTTPTGPGDAWTYAAALRPTGEILVLTSKVAPTGSEVRLFRYRPDGSLDPAFDGDGCAVLKIGTGNRGTTMALQPDGKILVAGHTISPVSGFAARLLPDGSLDSSFGQSGIATGYPGSDSRAMAVMPDGGNCNHRCPWRRASVQQLLLGQVHDERYFRSLVRSGGDRGNHFSQGRLRYHDGPSTGWRDSRGGILQAAGLQRHFRRSP